MTQQGLRQASARAISGFAPGANYNEDLLRLFDAQGIPAGTFDERQLRWINARLGSSYTNLREAMQVYAVGQGAYNWSAMGSLENTVNFTRAMPSGSTYTRTGAATGLTAAGLLTAFAADAPQRTDRGLAIEPAGTNLLLNSVFAGGGAAPTSWTRPSGTGTSAPAASSLLASVSAYAQSATAERPHLAQTATVGVGTHTLSFYVEAITGTIIAINMVLQAFGTATFGTTVYPACPANPSGGLAGVIGVGRMDIQLPVSVGGTFGAWVGVGAGSPATGSATFSLPVLEVSDRPTSPILTTGATATRGLPVFTEVVPAGRTKALLTYADGTTTLVTSLTPGGTFDYVAPIIAAGKGKFGASELVSRAWQA